MKVSRKESGSIGQNESESFSHHSNQLGEFELQVDCHCFCHIGHWSHLQIFSVLAATNVIVMKKIMFLFVCISMVSLVSYAPQG